MPRSVNPGMEIQQHIARSNTRPGIGDLPIELVLEVLFYSLEDQFGYPVALHDLAQVCVTWRDVVLSEARFWTILTLQWGGRWARWATQRSGNLPLLIFSDSRVDRDGAFRRVANAIEPHAHRCHTFVLRPDDLWQDQFDIRPFVQEAMLGSSSTLGAFAIPSSSRDRLCPANYIRGQAPIFRELAIPDYLIRKLQPIMTDLTYLDIWRGLGDQLEIKLGWLLAVLQSSPRLWHFSLDGQDIKQVGRASRKFSPVHLPCLETVKLDLLHSDAIDVLLRTIDAPMCSKARVQWVHEVPELEFTSPGEGLTARMLSALLDAQSLIIMAQEEVLTIEFVTPQTSVEWEFSFSESNWRLNLSRLIRLDFPSLTRITLDVNIVEIKVDASLEAKMPNVENLTLMVGTEADWEEVMAFLTGAGDAPLNWPKLHTLIIEPGYGCDPVALPLLRFLQRRVRPSTACSTVTQTCNTSQPVAPRFRKLRVDGAVSGLDDAVEAEIRELVDVLETY